MRATELSWGPIAAELMLGKTVLVLDQPSPRVTGRLASRIEIRGIYRVNVRKTDRGTVVWLTKKGEQ